jgi:hypothetical protein
MENASNALIVKIAKNLNAYHISFDDGSVDMEICGRRVRVASECSSYRVEVFHDCGTHFEPVKMFRSLPPSVVAGVIKRELQA